MSPRVPAFRHGARPSGTAEALKCRAIVLNGIMHFDMVPVSLRGNQLPSALHDPLSSATQAGPCGAPKEK